VQQQDRLAVVGGDLGVEDEVADPRGRRRAAHALGRHPDLVRL
jgi:hypothetical protein